MLQPTGYKSFFELQATPRANINQIVKRVKKKAFLWAGYFINAYCRVSDTSP